MSMKPVGCCDLWGNLYSGTNAPGMADLPAIIGRADFDCAAHLVEPRPHTLTQTVDESLFPRRREFLARERRRYGRLALRAIQIIGRQQGDPIVVISLVQNVANGVESPRRRLACSDVIDQQ